MNAVEIEEAVSKLATEPFDSERFPYAFLEAFGNKETTLKRLKSGTSNQSDLPGGVLQRSNIHLKTCPEGEVTATLAALRQSLATTKQKARFILTTDGQSFEAENLVDGEVIACNYADFHDHFGFFLPLAGITTVKQIRDNAFDIKATGRLNRLYIELLKDNPNWDTAARREDLNHFLARLIFCFFAENTGIFHGKGLFTATVEQMSAKDSSNTHEIVSELFRAMNVPTQHEGQLDNRYRADAEIKSWANGFPYVNGGLFTGNVEVPRFSKIARSYLLHIGSLDWTKINPDIFGSMIQAVADDDERGALGMHYTSVPNILKVLTYARDGSSTRANALGMRPMQERAFQRRGEQYLLIKSPPASGKSRALMFIALDKLANQGIKQAIIVVPEKSIGASFHDEPLSQAGFPADWTVSPRWNLCDAPGDDNGGKVAAVGSFLASNDQVLVCTHATFRFALDRFGVAAFDDRLIAVDEFHHVSSNPDNRLGTWQGKDPQTGFDLVELPGGRVLRVADLVDDGPSRHAKVLAALKDPAQKFNRDHVDLIIALGMAREGFDWIRCEHALTVGYRSSLTEIVQIIGRATRDAPGKTHARFTNLIAEPDASEDTVAEAVNDTLKAIAASLLMEQVLAPRFEFKPKHPNNGPTPGFDYGPEGYDPNRCNVGVNATTGQVQLEIKGLAEPKSQEAQRICREDLNELVTTLVQDKQALERGMFDEELVPEELTQVRMGKIVKEKFPNLDVEDQEAVRQHAVAALNLVQKAKQTLGDSGGDAEARNTALIDGVRKYALLVTELDIDLIDRINPFGEAYAILAKAMTEERLKQVAEVIAGRRVNLTMEEARDLAKRALQFKQEKGRLPELTATDPWEKHMAEGVAFLQRKVKEGKNA